MKSEFLSNVSHELKTPLVSIRGYSELLYDEKLGNLPQSHKKALEAIIRNTERLTRLIDSLLFLSVQQMGKPEIRMKPLPLSIDEIITTSMADMKVQAEKKDITLIKDTPAELIVIGDRDRLTEVLLNLIDNAIKFTPPGGKITVKARDEDDIIHITVIDTGIGIPENVISSLFQRFFQADASITRKYGGTGLGLYICKNIIDAHKGEIWVESKLGEGTTVHIRLPKKFEG
jgi:signal transduction histidine kinase